MIQLPKLILASGSPRRAEILRAVGWEFEKRVADVDETELENEDPADYVCRLAREKALTIAAQIGNGFVLGADTTVVIGGEIIGKPADLDEARRMLKKLSGQTHEVLTGVSLVKAVNGATKRKTAFERTRVRFAPLDEREIEFLVLEGAPLDKAGAYAVQAQAALFIEGIEGDYWNVVGLPINLVYRLLQEFR